MGVISEEARKAKVNGTTASFFGFLLFSPPTALSFVRDINKEKILLQCVNQSFAEFYSVLNELTQIASCLEVLACIISLS